MGRFWGILEVPWGESSDGEGEGQGDACESRGCGFSGADGRVGARLEATGKGLLVARRGFGWRNGVSERSKRRRRAPEKLEESFAASYGSSISPTKKERKLLF